MKVSSAVSAILAILNETTDLYLRHAGSHAFFLLEPPQKIVVLKRDSSLAIRMAAVTALRRSKSPYLVEFLTDGEPAVVNKAICSINDQNVVEVRARVGALLDHTADRPHTTMFRRRMLHSAFCTDHEANARRVIKVALDPKTPPPVGQSTGRVAPLPTRDPEIICKVLDGGVTSLVQVDGKFLESALAKPSTQAALDDLVKATSSSSAQRQQEAWKLAAEITAPGAAYLFVSVLAALEKSDGAARCRSQAPRT